MTKLIEALKRVNDQIDYENEQDLIEDGLFNSFEIIEAISEIEEAFGIEVPPKEIKNENKLFYSKKDKKGSMKDVNIADYLIEYDNNTGIIVLKAGNAGGFNLIELMRQYMPLHDINIKRLKVKKDDSGK